MMPAQKQGQRHEQGSISNRIRTLRFMNGEMSQAELGQRIGLTRQTIAAIEAGKYSPSLEAAFRIAQVFNVPLGEVFQWVQASPAP
jgi:putative transcriptional regulator